MGRTTHGSLIFISVQPPALPSFPLFKCAPSSLLFGKDLRWLYSSLFAQKPEQQKEQKHERIKASSHQHYPSDHTCTSCLLNVLTHAPVTQASKFIYIILCLSSQRWSSVIAAPVAMEQRVKKLLEVIDACVHLDGPAGRASWVSGSSYACSSLSCYNTKKLSVCKLLPHNQELSNQTWHTGIS